MINVLYKLYTDDGHVGYGIWQRLALQNDNCFKFKTSASAGQSNMKDTVSSEYSVFIRIYQPLRCFSYSNYAWGLNEAGDLYVD